MASFKLIYKKKNSYTRHFYIDYMTRLIISNKKNIISVHDKYRFKNSVKLLKAFPLQHGLFCVSTDMSDFNICL